MARDTVFVINSKLCRNTLDTVKIDSMPVCFHVSVLKLFILELMIICLDAYIIMNK